MCQVRQDLANVSGSPDNVFTGRLVGGYLDGVRIEIEPGREVIEMDPLVIFGNPPELINELRQETWTYRYAGVEPGVGGPEALFEHVEPAART